jgi:putative transcriptional regulator
MPRTRAIVPNMGFPLLLERWSSRRRLVGSLMIAVIMVRRGSTPSPNPLAPFCLHLHHARRHSSYHFSPARKPAGATALATVRVTKAQLEKSLAETDWKALDALTDRDIAHAVATDPDAAPILTAAETAASLVRTIRTRLCLSQTAFAARFHIPIGTLRDWEQARRRPDAPALAYLRVIARDPDAVARALAAA